MINSETAKVLINDTSEELIKNRKSLNILNDLPSDIEEAIRNHPLFRNASEETISTLCKVMKSRIFSSGDKIIQEGDEGKVIFFLIKGEVDILSSDEEIIYATLYSGSFFGEVALLKNVNRTANVVARSKCFLLSLHKQDYLELTNLDFWKQIEEEASIRLDSLISRKNLSYEIPTYNSNVVAGNSGSDNDLNNIIDYDLLTSALKKLPLLQFCDSDVLDDISALLKTINFQPGDIELSNSTTSIILILNGIVTTPNQDEKRKGSLVQYEFYGKLVLDPFATVETETLLALSSGSACILESVDVMELMDSNSKAKEQIELGLVQSLDTSLENLVMDPIHKQSSSSSNVKSFDSQRLIITSGEKRRASVAVWSDPSLMKVADKKKSPSNNKSKLSSPTNQVQGASPFVLAMIEKPKIFRVVSEHLKLRDMFVLASVCRSIYNEVAKMTTFGMNLDLTDYVNNINNLGIQGITNLWKYSIRSLNLRGCFKINNIGLSYIAGNCPNLEILNLHSCWEVSSQGLTVLSEGCPKLRSIDLSNCRKIDSVGVVSLLDNTQLEEIILSYCKSLNNDLYKDPFLFSNLKKINLQRCTTITDVGYRHLDGHTLGIEYLILSDCSFLTDASLDIICRSCPNLKTLSVSFVCGLTEKSAEYISTLVDLETLDVSFCGNLMTNTALEQIGKSMQLKRLGVRGCFKISQQAMLDYLTTATSLNCLNATQCKNISIDYMKRNFTTITFMDTESVVENDPLAKFLTSTKYPMGTRQRTKTI